MNYADIKLGTWYPLGGMYKVVEGMVQLARDQGVNLITNCEIESFTFDKGNIKAAHGSNQTFDVDVVVAGADYHHVETRLLPQSLRSYTDQYWQKRTLAPSSLLFYLGFDCKIPTLEHHTLFFDADFHIHSEEIYQRPSWPSSPLFYVNMPSKTDPEVGPPDGETMVILIPVAPDLKDDDATREKYFEIVMRRIEKITGHDLQKHIVVKKSYAHRDFISDYHAFKGNAYGLANILRQTAILKPSLKSKKVKNLYYTGQLTVPGPGVPPSLISGKVVSKVIEKHFHRV
jgi:phytoene desaturase